MSSCLRRYRALRVGVAIVVLLGVMPSAAHAAVRTSTTPSPTPSTSQPAPPDQTQPHLNQPGAATPTAPVTQPGSSNITQPVQGSTGTTATGPTREVFGFVDAGNLGNPYVGYSTWNFNLLSTVAFFAIHVRYDGQLVGDSDFTVWDSSTLSGLVTTAHAHGVKVVVTIMGPSNPTDLCDALYNGNKTTVPEIVNQVVAKGVDGVNIDYEGELQECTNNDPSLDQSNQTLLTNFASQLRTGLNNARPGYYLSIDTYSGSALGNDGFFNIPNLNQYVDSFFVMAYDMDYPNSTLPPLNCSRYCLGPVSPLTYYYWNDTNSMSEYSGVVGPGKVILGQPYYGRVACVSYPYAHSYPSGQVFSPTYLDSASVSSSPDVEAGTFSTGRDGGDPAGFDRWDTWYDLRDNCWKEMYWEDTTTLASRYNLVNRDNLRGVGLFTLDYGGGAPELWDVLSAYFQVWSAGYDTSQVPTSWVAGQTQTFPVTVTNSGTFTWPSGGSNPVKLDLHFASQPGASPSSWLTSQVYPLPSDVAPGASVTISVTATAPSSTGSMYLEAEMFKTQQFWFAQRQPTLVSVAPQTWVAQYDMSQAPTSWQAGQTKSFTVTITNTGNVVWPSGTANPVELDLHFTTVQGGSAKETYWLTSQVFTLPADVPANGSTTVTVSVTAPQTSGYVYLEAEMFKNQQFWFHQWQPVAVTVYGAWGASYDLSQAPTSGWGAGQSKTFQVTVTNQGTQAWPAGGANPVELDLHFTTVPGGSTKLTYWLTSQVYQLPSDVAPGASATLSVTVTAPNRVGALYLEAEMFKNQQFWFQEWSSVPITLLPAWVASYDTCQVPTVWAPGKSQTVSITLTNTGAATWPSSGPNPVELDLHFTSVPGGSSHISSWLTSQIYALPSDVAPGGNVTLSVSATAPSSSGSLYLEAEMFKNQQFWFQQSQSVPAAVGTLAWGADYNACAAPRSWTKGQSQTFQITLTNAGTQAWPSTGSNPVDLDVHFTTVPGGSAQISNWLNSYIIALPSDVAPGQSVTVTVTVAAPSTGGAMYLEAQVFKVQQFWIQQWQTVAVTVS
jgi:spore germination protein YaaH